MLEDLNWFILETIRDDYNLNLLLQSTFLANTTMAEKMTIPIVIIRIFFLRETCIVPKLLSSKDVIRTALVHTKNVLSVD